MKVSELAGAMFSEQQVKIDVNWFACMDGEDPTVFHGCIDSIPEEIKDKKVSCFSAINNEVYIIIE